MTDMLADAFLYAREIHRGQTRRKTRASAIAHLLGVASLTMELGGDEGEAIAALLHDAVESAGGRQRLEDIRRRFGEQVAVIVEGCSDWIAGPHGSEEERPRWRERKERYIAELAQAENSIVLVSGSDKVQNARAIARQYVVHGEAIFGEYTRSREETLWYYRALLAALELRAPKELTAELRQALTIIEGDQP